MISVTIRKKSTQQNQKSSIDGCILKLKKLWLCYTQVFTDTNNTRNKANTAYLINIK